MDPYTLFLLYLGFIAIVVCAIAILLFRLRVVRRGVVSRSLNLELISVRFAPREAAQNASQQNDNLQQAREKIALMEQCFVNLHQIRDSFLRTVMYGKPVFGLELTIPAASEELAFYIAVPRRFARTAEKVIQGIFPDAHLEISKDYNIFNPNGVAVGSRIRLKENSFYPIRTYQKLEGDPMRAVTNVFTKLAREGEGAALQIIAYPAPAKWKAKLKKHAKNIFQGKPNYNALGKAVRAVEVVTGTGAPLQNQQQQMNMQQRITPLEEEKVRAMEGKAGKALFETNIRIVASAADIPRAEAILQSLEVAFAQFTDPNLNGFSVERLHNKSLKNLLFNFSFRIYDGRSRAVLSTEELTSIFHFPNVTIETPHIKSMKAKEAPAPVNVPGEGLLLGYNTFRGEKRDIRLSDDDRRRHLYIIGQTGTGKTSFMKTLIQQDIMEGRGVCYIDPHGQDIEDILAMIPRHRAQDVIYFNPGDIERPMGLNFLEYDTNFPEQKTFIVNELFSIFQKLYGAVPESLGPMFEQYFRNATMLVMDDPQSGNTLLEISRVMSDKDFRDLKLSRAKNIVVKNFWTEVAEKAGGEGELRNMVPYITSKFDVFLANEIMRPIVAQEKSAFNFRDIMDSRKIFLVNLSKGRLGDINSSLIGLIIIGKILMAAFSRVDIADQERRQDFYLYIDEFQNVTTDSIATILSEARKFRLDLTIAHQFVGQLQENIKKAVFGNVGSMASFRIGADDAEFISKQFKPIFSEQDLLNLDNYNCYIKLLVGGQTAPAFSMKTYPTAKGDREAAEIIKEISRTKYGKPREEVEQDVMERYEKQAV
ncbi:MAG: DUF87 domain-containing protein [Candidatus Sungbacteria bacterium]|nr:DUF87 domain-containing protein [Candidatus Sungbacteria bacterium]